MTLEPMAWTYLFNDSARFVEGFAAACRFFGKNATTFLSHRMTTKTLDSHVTSIIFILFT